MNYYQKNGTAFDIKNGNPELSGAVNQPQQKLASISSGDRSKKIKSKF